MQIKNNNGVYFYGKDEEDSKLGVIVTGIVLFALIWAMAVVI